MIADFPVERGHILQFARAIGDVNPIYRDEAYAATTEVGGIIAPPTFVEAGQHFDSDFAYHPEPGRPWFGSGRRPSGAAPPGESGGTSFHAETHLSYHRLLRAGAVLHTVPADSDCWTRTGRRGGALHFTQHVTDYLDRDNQPVVSARVVSVHTERVVDPSDTGRSRPSSVPPRAAGDEAHSESGFPTAVGASRSQELVDDLTRGQIIQYAGASGDVSPQHTDEVYARVVGGYPSIFAHGMLTMGMTARVLTDWLGDGRLLRYGMRFLAQVWPGDALSAHARVRRVDEGARQRVVECDVWTVTNGARLVASGYATARIDP